MIDEIFGLWCLVCESFLPCAADGDTCRRCGSSLVVKAKVVDRESWNCPRCGVSVLDVMKPTANVTPPFCRNCAAVL